LNDEGLSQSIKVEQRLTASDRRKTRENCRKDYQIGALLFMFGSEVLAVAKQGHGNKLMLLTSVSL
jgi:hypothetical protein